MKRFLVITSFLLPTLFLTACSSFPKLPFINWMSNTSSTQQDLNSEITGTWKDESGIISIFNNGHFETYTTDTREKLAEGSYMITGDQTINLQLRSLVRGTISNVQCNLTSFSRNLNCSPETGTGFTLTRVNAQTNL